MSCSNVQSCATFFIAYVYKCTVIQKHLRPRKSSMDGLFLMIKKLFSPNIL